MAKLSIKIEQIYVVSVFDGKFIVGGDVYIDFPWHSLRNCFVYASDKDCLKTLLASAASGGYMILDGTDDVNRNGLRGFIVGIGVDGWMGTVRCCTLDMWCMEVEPGDVISQTGFAQEKLRGVCNRLNEEDVPFKPSGVVWLSSLYRKLNQEPSDVSDPLPVDVVSLCRRAHVGGPVVHARTTLSPFVQLDRDRAYGNVMLEDLPCGLPYEVPIDEKNSLRRWRPRDLMSSIGIADATIEVNHGPSVPLFPLLRPHASLGRNRILYATGRFRGVWCTAELVFLEEMGLGSVIALHRVVTFEAQPVLRLIIKYLRSIESDLPIKVKRLEHKLYGVCAKNESLKRFATGRTGDPPLLGDLLQSKVLQRLGPNATISPYKILGGTRQVSRHPLYEVTGRIIGKAPYGTVFRPDRSAWITMRNRVEMARVILQLDYALKSERSGRYVGRVNVDGIDIEADIAKIPKMDGISVRDYGPRLDIYRTGAWYSVNHDGVHKVEAAGTTIPENCSQEDLVKILRHDLDRDCGPFAGGRLWPSIKGELDPRLRSGVYSEPFHLDEEMVRLLGFSGQA